MNRYRVEMSHDELTAFLAKAKGKVEVEILSAEPVAKGNPRQAAASRAPRGSKVNEAILGALAAGPQTAKNLKAALENAGLSAGSLSTGLAQLQKAGRVERGADGSYAAKLKMAAE